MWRSRHTIAMQQLKFPLSKTKNVQLFDPDKPPKSKAGAHKHSAGVVLEQEGRLSALEPRKTGKRKSYQRTRAGCARFLSAL